MMKHLKRLLIPLLLLALLTACTGEPEETTLPPATEPAVTEATVPATEPIAVKPEIPEDYVCLNDLIAGTGISIKIQGPKILLSEDGLTLVLSTERKELYQDQYIMAVMKGNPILKDGKLYIQKDFFRSFFCEEGTDRISMFHSVLFFPELVRGALENPDHSSFTRRVYEEICLPQSMGITMPHIDPERIFNDGTLSWMVADMHEKLLHYGYTGEYVTSEYDIIINSQTLKSEGISDDDSMTVGEYKRLEQARAHQEFLTNQLTEEQRAFLAEKGIDPVDYEFLFNWFCDPVLAVADKDLLEATDEELKYALTICYRDSMSALGTAFHLQFLPPDFPVPDYAENAG